MDSERFLVVPWRDFLELPRKVSGRRVGDSTSCLSVIRQTVFSSFPVTDSENFETTSGLFGSPSVLASAAHLLKIGTIQRRFAWPLRKDDTQDVKRSIF